MILFSLKKYSQKGFVKNNGDYIIYTRIWTKKHGWTPFLKSKRIKKKNR